MNNFSTLNFSRADNMMIKQEQQVFSEKLLLWFGVKKRDLPWRKSYEPYHVWVSEIMLQQTQMERGVAYFERWIERFPNVYSVAESSIDEILKLWEGLGYYSRAKKLYETAKIIVCKFNGKFPSSIKELQALPGIGEYTAGAIASIAFNFPVPAVDANVERVFARVFDISASCRTPESSSFIRQTIKQLIPANHAREFNQAIMELGALVCKKRPLCISCPLEDICEAKRLGVIEDRPLIAKKKIYTSLQVVTGVLAWKGYLFIQKRLDRGVWAGLWEFPGGKLEEGESVEQATTREFFEETSFTVQPVHKLGVINHAYTRYRVTLHCFLCDLQDWNGQKDENGMPKPVLTAATDYRWILPTEVTLRTLPAGHRKLIDSYPNEILQHCTLSLKSITVQNHKMELSQPLLGIRK